MFNSLLYSLTLVSAALLSVGFAPAAASTNALPTPPIKASAMHASGTFTVKISPQNPDNEDAKAGGITRLSMLKQFSGALNATGRGEMLAVGDGRSSGAYVALERIEGSLDGCDGSFQLMHRAGLRGGKPVGWSVEVVPDSGTGALTGISGTLQIVITEGVHHYEFSYELGESCKH